MLLRWHIYAPALGVAICGRICRKRQIWGGENASRMLQKRCELPYSAPIVKQKDKSLALLIICYARHCIKACPEGFKPPTCGLEDCEKSVATSVLYALAPQNKKWLAGYEAVWKGQVFHLRHNALPHGTCDVAAILLVVCCRTLQHCWSWVSYSNLYTRYECRTFDELSFNKRVSPFHVLKFHRVKNLLYSICRT